MFKRGYAPEEQYRTRGEQGPWTDVYALCATMYRCMTGVIPPESIERFYKDSMKSMQELHISCPPYVEQAMKKGMGIYKEDRYSSMEELYTALYLRTDNSGMVSSSQRNSEAHPDEINKNKSDNTKRTRTLLGVGILGLAVCCAAAGIFFSRRNKTESIDAPVTASGSNLTDTPVPTEASISTETPTPTAEPTPIATPTPTAEPTPTETPAPTAAPVPSAVPQSPSYMTYYVVNCKQSITLRTSPSTSAGEICQIPLGAAVSYIEAAENGFYKIIYNGQTGYSLASYLSTEKQSSAVPQSPSYMTYYVVNCKQSITLRTSPSTSAGEICQIPLGAAVSYISAADNGFYYICYNGNYGYSLASYLSSDSGYNTYDTCRVVNCNESITLRTSPDTSAGEICQIPLGATVSYVANAGNGFYEIYYMGNHGYSLASYLEFE